MLTEKTATTHNLNRAKAHKGPQPGEEGFVSASGLAGAKY